MDSSDKSTKKIFISYAWDDKELAETILSFSNKLRSNGIDSTIDQYEENPDMGWPIWMENQIENADYVLIVSTQVYKEKFNQCREGKGVSWEISSIYQSLYNLRGHNDKFIPVILNDNDTQYVLKALQPYTIYNIHTQFEKLKNRILGIPNTVKPPLLSLPEKKRKCLFVSSPIDLDLWDRARWSGTVFLNVPENGWLLGLLFHGDKNAAKEIFENWQKYNNIDDYLEVTFIEGDIEGFPPGGYACLISPNVRASFDRAQESVDDEPMILAVSRFQRMYPTDNYAMYNAFKNVWRANIGRPMPVIPVTMIDSEGDSNQNNLEPHFERIVYVKNVKYKKVEDINKWDIERCVIPKYSSEFLNM